MMVGNKTSTGTGSTGNGSTGNCSTGNGSTGNWSISDYSTGHFSTVDDSGFGAFNKPCTREQWAQADKPTWLYFDLTEWVDKNDMTQEEKTANPKHETTGSYLKVYGYQEAWRRAYESVSREEQLKVKDLPNFDSAVFYEISGIRIDDDVKHEIMVDGRRYVLAEEA